MELFSFLALATGMVVLTTSIHLGGLAALIALMRTCKVVIDLCPGPGLTEQLKTLLTYKNTRAIPGQATPPLGIYALHTQLEETMLRQWSRPL